MVRKLTIILAENELDIYGQGVELRWFNVTANEGNRITPSIIALLMTRH
jgi:hypothetical protein